MNKDVLEEKIKQLTPEEQEQVLKFIDDILNKKSVPPRHKPKFDWAGGLAHLKDKYTSVELQKKINEWWTEDV